MKNMDKRMAEILAQWIIQTQKTKHCETVCISMEHTVPEYINVHTEVQGFMYLSVTFHMVTPNGSAWGDLL